VQAEIVVGEDGHVVSARATSGPPERYKACENAARKWVFKPYVVLDKPVEVEQKVQCSNNSIDSAFFLIEVDRFPYKGQFDLPDSSFTCV
jgi:hypothetical protein